MIPLVFLLNRSRWAGSNFLPVLYTVFRRLNLNLEAHTRFAPDEQFEIQEKPAGVLRAPEESLIPQALIPQALNP